MKSRTEPTQKQLIADFFERGIVPQLHFMYGEDLGMALPRELLGIMGFDPKADPRTLPEQERQRWLESTNSAIRLIPMVWEELAGRPVREAVRLMDEARAVNDLMHARRAAALLSLVANLFIAWNFSRLSMYLSREFVESVPMALIRRNAVLLMPMDFDVKNFHDYVMLFRLVNRMWKEDMGRVKATAPATAPRRPGNGKAAAQPAAESPRLMKPGTREERMAGYVPREKPVAPPTRANGNAGVEKAAATFRLFDPLAHALDEIESDEPEVAVGLCALLADGRVSRDSVNRLIIGGPLARKVFLAAARDPAFISRFGDSMDAAAKGIGYVGGVGVKEADARRAFGGPNGRAIFEWLLSRRLLNLHGHDRTAYLSRDVET